MSVVEVKKIKTQYRAVEFDSSNGSDSHAEANELFDWADSFGLGYQNGLDEWMPCIEIPERKPSYPGETRSVYVKHGDWIVASSRGKVKVMTDNEYSELFEEKE